MKKFFKYVGFSTASTEAARRRQWKLYDADLIKRDLLNHFNTRKGDRIGRATYGCAIWDYLMEQRTPELIELIGEAADEVFNADSRISHTGAEVYPWDHGVIISTQITNQSTGETSEFKAQFDARQGMIS